MLQDYQVTNIPTAARNMTMVASQPRTRSIPELKVNLPMTLALPTISITTAMIGTAAIPLMIAHKNRALMGVT
jgi:hypothetical protein